MSWAQTTTWTIDALWRSSWQAALLAVGVLLVRWTLGQRLSPRWRCRLWLLVALRLILPVLPASPWSMFNLFPNAHDDRVTEYPVVIRVIQLHAFVPATTRAQPPSAPTICWPAIIASVWLGGAALLFIRIAVANARFSRRLNDSADAGPGWIVDIASACAREAGVRKPPAIVMTPLVSTPSLFGLLHPRLLLPSDLPDRLTPQEARWVVLHELAHLRRHDLLLGWLMCIVQIVHWFNPMAWVAAKFWRIDMESACDEEVLTKTTESGRSGYGMVLLKLAAKTSAAAPRPAMGMIDAKWQLRRRIVFISRLKRPALGWSISAACLLLIFGLAGLTDARRAFAGIAAVSPATMETRVYDVRDIVQLHQTLFGSELTMPGFVKTIRREITPDVWANGATISVTPDNRIVVVDAPPATHAALQTWLDDHRLAISTTCMIVTVDPAALNHLKGSSGSLGSVDWTSATKTSTPVLLKSIELFAIIGAIQDNHNTIIAAPQVTTFNHAKGSVGMYTDFSYIADVTATKKPTGNSDVSATVGQAPDGVWFDCLPTLSADHHTVSLTLSVKANQVLGFVELPTPKIPNGWVQVPIQRKYEVAATVSIAEGCSAVFCAMPVENVTEAHFQPARAGDPRWSDQAMLMIVTPSISDHRH